MGMEANRKSFSLEVMGLLFSPALFGSQKCKHHPWYRLNNRIGENVVVCLILWHRSPFLPICLHALPQPGLPQLPLLASSSVLPPLWRGGLQSRRRCLWRFNTSSIPDCIWSVINTTYLQRARPQLDATVAQSRWILSSVKPLSLLKSH